jgi:hypothetical protein
MNLLDATVTLIKCSNNYASHDRTAMRAVKRMEKRLEVKIEIVPKEKIREPKKPKQLPATASPECNGDMGV